MKEIILKFLENKQYIKIQIPCFPTKTLNHQYRLGRNKHTGKVIKYVDKEILQYRKIIGYIVSSNMSKIKQFNFNKELNLILIFNSPNWYCKNGKVRKKDIDNMLKTVIDSLSKSIGFDDKNIFNLHAIKEKTSKEFIDVYIF